MAESTESTASDNSTHD